MESKAFEKSATRALNYVNNKSEAKGNIVVQLTRGECHMMKRRASEQTSLAEQRISVSIEQKLAGKNRWDSSFRRLKQLYSHHELRK